jgi:hypothetical protein
MAKLQHSRQNTSATFSTILLSFFAKAVNPEIRKIIDQTSCTLLTNRSTFSFSNRYCRMELLFSYFCGMRKRINHLFVFCLLLLSVSHGFGQTGYVWTTSVGGPLYSEFGLDVACDDQGNVFLVGEYLDGAVIGDSTYTSLGDNDLFIAKYDPEGNPLWVRVHGSTQLDRLYAVDAGPEGDAYVGGYGKVTFPMRLAGPDLHARDAIVARYRSNGDLVWGNIMDGDVFSEAQDVVGLQDLGCFATGQYQTTGWFGTDTLVGNGSSDAYLVRFDSVGNYVWGRTIGGSLEDKPWAMGIDAEENVVVGGYFKGTAYFGNDTLTATAGQDAFIAKYASDGTPIWAKKLSGPVDDFVFGMKTSEDGDTYFTGNFEDYIVFGNDTVFGTSAEDIFYGKMDADGDLVWWKSANGSSIDAPQDLEIDAEENIYIGGYFFGTLDWDGNTTISAGFDDMFFTKMDSNGTVLIFETSHFPDTRDVFGLGVDPAQNMVATGSFIQYVNFGGDTIFSVDNSIDIFLTKYATRNVEVVFDTLTGSPYCGGDLFHVEFSAYGDLDSGNVFYLELSDASGSFAAPDTIGMLTSQYGGTITGTIPPGLPFGTGYRARVVSTSPGFTTADNGFDITLDPSTAIPVSIIGDSVLCNGFPIQLQIDQGFASQLWSNGDTTYFIVVTIPGLYTVEAVDSNGCSNIDQLNVSSCVASDESHIPLSFNAYPNPVQNQLIIEGEGAGAWQLDLVDMAGRSVWQNQFESGNLKWRKTASVAHLPAGMYFLRARLNDRNSSRKIIVE